jgi:hypothetical protein
VNHFPQNIQVTLGGAGQSFCHRLSANDTDFKMEAFSFPKNGKMAF